MLELKASMVKLGSSWGQAGVKLGSSWGQPGVNLHCPTTLMGLGRLGLVERLGMTTAEICFVIAAPPWPSPWCSGAS